MSQTDFLKNLVRTDLNLLTVLHALLEHGSTQAAANNIGRTQSAVSHALGRLRILFDDPLFIRSGPKLTPTKLALQMQQPLQRILHDVTNLIDSGMQFDPLTSDRQIVISAADIALSLAMEIADSARRDAPKLRIRIKDSNEGLSDLINGETDLLISLYRNEVLAGLELVPVVNLQWSVFARRDHPISRTPSKEEWASYDHVQVYTGTNRSPINDAATVFGIERTVNIQVRNFLQALHVVGRSDALFTTMGDLARPLAHSMGLKEVELPFQVSPVPMALVTRTRKHDPLSSWIYNHANDVVKDTFHQATPITATQRSSSQIK